MNLCIFFLFFVGGCMGLEDFEDFEFRAAATKNERVCWREAVRNFTNTEGEVETCVCQITSEKILLVPVRRWSCRRVEVPGMIQMTPPSIQDVPASTSSTPLLIFQTSQHHVVTNNYPTPASYTGPKTPIPLPTPPSYHENFGNNAVQCQHGLVQQQSPPQQQQQNFNQYPIYPSHAYPYPPTYP